MTDTPPTPPSSLGVDRTVLAAERTYAAWIRTGLAFMATGVGTKALLSPAVPAVFLSVAGTVLILFSIFCFGAAVWRELFAYRAWPTADFPRIPQWILFLTSGVLIVVSLGALFIIWFHL